MANKDTENLNGDERTQKVFKTREETSLTDITLGLVGSTHKGPAFVPQTFQTFNLDNIPDGTLNTFENQFGSLEELSDHNLTHYSAYEWFNQGGEQLSITRVLGTGSGSGFTVGEQIVSGSSELGKLGESSFATTGGSSGGTYFLGQVIENDQFESITVSNVVIKHRISSYNDYLEQIGISGNAERGLVLTECLFTPYGSNLFLEKKDIAPRSLVDIQADLTEQVFSNNLIGNFSEIGEPKLFVSGLKNTEYSYVETFNKENLRHYQYKENKVNIESRWNLHKGHLNYASWGSQIDFKQTNLDAANSNITKVFLVQKSNDTPDYENFISSYKTAETPWVVSQPLNREGLATNRVDMHQKCIKLFKFVALDDGEIGNRYRIRISPQRSGNRITKDWAKFGVTVWEYNKKTNSFKQLLQYRDLDLNPDSPDYIARVFGTKYEYYSTETSKVQTDGIYETRNNHLRVVVNDKIEYNEVDSWDLIPAGFNPYPRIDASNLTYSNEKTRQKPVEYASNLLFANNSSEVNADDNFTLREDKNWGVNFENTSSLKIKEKLFNSKSFTIRVKKYKEYELGSIRRFTQYAKYFQDSLASSNVWVRDLEDNEIDPTHSFFHLEKILKEKVADGGGAQNQWLYSMYRRDGKDPSNINSLGIASGSFSYVNIEEELKHNSGGDSINSEYLNFDFFTCGGFDGLNILDHDKHMLNQAALIREIEDEKKDGSTSGVTRDSYELAHDILIDDANAEIDSLVFPQVGHNVFNKRIANICNEKEKYVSILNVADFYSDGINLDSNYHEYNPEEVNPARRVSIKEDIRGKLSDGENVTVDSVTNAYFNGKYILNVCNSLESAFLDSVIPEKIFTNLPSFRLVSAMPRSLRLPLDSISNYESSDIKVQKILNSTFSSSSNNDYSSLIRKSMSSSVNFLVEEDAKIVLNSSNTAINNRNSLNRFLHNVRIMIDIKKKLKYLLFQTEVLFNNNSSIANIAFKLNIDVQSLLQGYVDRGIIKSFYVKNNTGQTIIERLDMQKNILRSSIAISLFGKTDDVIEEIRLADLLSSIQNNLTEASGLDIILPTI